MTLAGVPVGGRVVLAGDGVRVVAVVAQQGGDWLRCDYAAPGVIVRALVTPDGRVTSLDVRGAVALRATPLEPLPPAETWHLVLASGARVAVVCTPERDEEYGGEVWTARAAPWDLEHTATSRDDPEAAVHRIVGSLARRVRAIEPPGVAAPALPGTDPEECERCGGPTGDAGCVAACAEDVCDPADWQVPPPDPVAAERGAIVVQIHAEADDRAAMESSRGDVVALALRVMAAKIAARGTP